MSGGSYNYLYCQADESGVELLARQNDLAQMHCRLRELDYATQAANATESILNDLDELQRKLEKIKSKSTVLKKVWEAVEYWDSCDWSEQAVRAAIADFEANQNKTTI